MMTVHSDITEVFGPARDQGERPTCLAFAMSDMNRFHAACEVLSAEYLYRGAAMRTTGWKPGDGTYLRHAIAVTSDTGLPGDALLPYELLEPGMPIPVLPDATTGTFYRNVFAGGKPVQAAEVKAALGQGIPVGLVLKITPEFVLAKDGFVEHSNNVFPNEFHAVIATAAATRNSDSADYIRVRNSWGAGWGDAGHAWLNAAYVNAYMVESFRI
jgi:hypothetical protein